MNKLLLIFLVLFYSIPPLIPACHSATNLAKGKPYTVSPTPNYPLSAPPTNTTALTDGAYTVGFFWTKKTTVGWQRSKIVEVLIDLEKESDIGSVVFSTARGKEADVYYPAHIAAFVGPDREHLLYVGDLVDDPENQPGSYQTKKFIRNDLGVRGRYVLLEAIPKGVFLFCDEIEVIQGKSILKEAGNFSVAQARAFTEQFTLIDGDKSIFNKMADNLAGMITDPAGAKQLEEIRQKINTLQKAGNAETAETDLLALRRSILYGKYPSESLHIQSVNPWASLNPISPLPDATETSLTLVLPIGGYDSRAIQITNILTHPAQVSLKLDKARNGSDLSLYQVPFIKTAAMEQVADSLVPARSDFTLRPGESRIVFLTVHGIQPGNWRRILYINSGDKITSLPVTIQVANIALPKKLSLNVVNWGYLDFKLIRDRQKNAVDDLLAHHTNVVVVPPAFLPMADLVNTLDFSRLESYLKLHRGFGKVLLFMNLRSENRLMLGGRYPFLGEEWKAAVKKWYEGARQAAIRAGFTPEQVYWYPFDEMYEKEIDQFLALAKWARKEIPGVRFYATLGEKNSEKALPFLDISQILNDDQLPGKFSAGKGEKWLYAASGPAKLLSPYTYYRLMSWKAFLNGFTGVGFWAYADAGWGDNPGTAWDDFDGKNPDYAVIYEGEGTSIVSSRRWEAWRMGIEDYELLAMYAKAKGAAAAKALAKSAMESPQDTAKADVVRRKILLELSK